MDNNINDININDLNDTNINQLYEDVIESPVLVASCKLTGQSWLNDYVALCYYVCDDGRPGGAGAYAYASAPCPSSY